MFKRLLRKMKKRKYQDINPEDIFLDSTNLPGFEEHRFEGRIERPMGRETFLILKIVLGVIVLALISRLWVLEINLGSTYVQISVNNRLERTLIFANRGVIYDRGMRELATNAVKDENSDFAGRLYAPIKGLAHVVGYVKYPLVDKSGVYYEKEYRAKDGVERAYDADLKGKNGLKLRETDVLGTVTSESIIDKPEEGKTLVLDRKSTRLNS